MASGFWSRSVTVEGATAAERALHREEKHDHLQEYLRWRGYSEPSERSQRRIDPRRLHPLTDVPNWLEASHERMERDPMTMTRSEKKATVTLQSRPDVGISDRGVGWRNRALLEEYDAHRTRLDAVGIFSTSANQTRASTMLHSRVQRMKVEEEAAGMMKRSKSGKNLLGSLSAPSLRHRGALPPIGGKARGPDGAPIRMVRRGSLAIHHARIAKKAQNVEA